MTYPFDIFRATGRGTGVSIAILCALLFAASPARAEGNFEIVKATADKVWRLNKQTGEIAICGMEGARLVCAAAQESAGGKALSPEELESRRKAALEAEKARRAEDARKDLAFMDRMIELFREFVKAAMEREAAGAK